MRATGKCANIMLMQIMKPYKILWNPKQKSLMNGETDGKKYSGIYCALSMLEFLGSLTRNW